MTPLRSGVRRHTEIQVRGPRTRATVSGMNLLQIYG